MNQTSADTGTEQITFVRGRKDGRKRRVCRLPIDILGSYDDGYAPMSLELTDGQWVQQIVKLSRIEREAQ